MIRLSVYACLLLSLATLTHIAYSNRKEHEENNAAEKTRAEAKVEAEMTQLDSLLKQKARDAVLQEYSDAIFERDQNHLIPTARLLSSLVEFDQCHVSYHSRNLANNVRLEKHENVPCSIAITQLTEDNARHLIIPELRICKSSSYLSFLPFLRTCMSIHRYPHFCFTPRESVAAIKTVQEGMKK